MTANSAVGRDCLRSEELMPASFFSRSVAAFSVSFCGAYFSMVSIYLAFSMANIVKVRGNTKILELICHYFLVYILLFVIFANR